MFPCDLHAPCFKTQIKSSSGSSLPPPPSSFALYDNIITFTLLWVKYYILDDTLCRFLPLVTPTETILLCLLWVSMLLIYFMSNSMMTCFFFLHFRKPLTWDETSGESESNSLDSGAVYLPVSSYSCSCSWQNDHISSSSSSQRLSNDGMWNHY